MQSCLRSIRDLKEEVGTDRDGAELRAKVNQKINEMNTVSGDLTTEIDEYGRIPVAFSYKKT